MKNQTEPTAILRAEFHLRAIEHALAILTSRAKQTRLDVSNGNKDFNWANVGDLEHVSNLLKEINEFGPELNLTVPKNVK